MRYTRKMMFSLVVKHTLTHTNADTKTHKMLANVIIFAPIEFYTIFFWRMFFHRSFVGRSILNLISGRFLHKWILSMIKKNRKSATTKKKCASINWSIGIFLVDHFVCPMICCRSIESSLIDEIVFNQTDEMNDNFIFISFRFELNSWNKRFEKNIFAWISNVNNYIYTKPKKTNNQFRCAALFFCLHKMDSAKTTKMSIIWFSIIFFSRLFRSKNSILFKYTMFFVFSLFFSGVLNIQISIQVAAQRKQSKIALSSNGSSEKIISSLRGKKQQLKTKQKEQKQNV